MLEWTPLRFLGSISYALYVFHFPVSAALHPMADSFEITDPAVYRWAMFAMTLAFSIPLCLLSRWLIELPAARLKQSLRSKLSSRADKMHQS
jgi:peptidoglycan/LPS O-acetylase OafA/YrhL